MKYLAVLLALAATNASGADIVFFRGSPEKMLGHDGVRPDTWRPRVMLVGDIVVGDDKRFLAVFKQAEAQSKEWKTDHTLRLDSDGGDVSTAMSIGRLVRTAQITTIVQKNNRCASACVLILAGGVWRIAWGNGRIGLHRPYFADSERATANGYEGFQRVYDSVIKAHNAYFTEMRIGSGLLDQMMKIPSNDIRWIDHATASRLNLLGMDPIYAEWERAQRIALKGQACIEWEDRHGTCWGRLGIEAYDRCVEIVGKPPLKCK